LPCRRLPEAVIRSLTGAQGSRWTRWWMLPWPIATLSTSTTTSGGTISTTFPWPTEISSSRVGWLMAAAEKSMITLPWFGLSARARVVRRVPRR
jgi:hypothetical protein